MWHNEFTKEELAEKLTSTTKSADHLNGLLRETEATNAILMEQIKVWVEGGGLPRSALCRLPLYPVCVHPTYKFTFQMQPQPLCHV